MVDRVPGGIGAGGDGRCEDLVVLQLMGQHDPVTCLSVLGDGVGLPVGIGYRNRAGNGFACDGPGVVDGRVAGLPDSLVAGLRLNPDINLPVCDGGAASCLQREGKGG